VFRRSKFADVVQEFPYLRAFLESATFPKSNAFYVNPLILTGSSRVDPHVDCRLVVTENVRIIPTLVSILYVRADKGMVGGSLTLNVGPDQEITIDPKANHLIHFRGDLVHSVSEVLGEHTRISVVCEQYNLPEPVLLGFPEFEILHDRDVAPRVPPVGEQVRDQ
jgi:2OG-Fe(II) oxygenase superfamily